MLCWYYFNVRLLKPFRMMPLSEQLIKRLSKTYEPDALVYQTFKGKDLAFKTNGAGEPVLLFIGRKGEDGQVTGDRYVRTLIHRADGSVLKDHWERKGKAT